MHFSLRLVCIFYPESSTYHLTNLHNTLLAEALILLGLESLMFFAFSVSFLHVLLFLDTDFVYANVFAIRPLETLLGNT